jgi:hypothetical protein
MNRGLARGFPREFPSFRGLVIGGTNPGQGLGNIQIGDGLSAQLSGTGNVYIGDSAGAYARGATNFVAIGAQSGEGAVEATTVIDLTGIVAIGVNARVAGSAGNAVAVGVGAICNNLGTAIGYNAQAGTNGVSIGNSAGANGTPGNSCVWVGYYAGQNASGTNNVGIGYYAGNASSGGGSVFVGYEAGYGPNGNTANYTSTASGQTLLGYETGQVSTTQVSYITCLGYITLAGAAGVVALGTDHTGVGASSSTQDEIKLGTANHTVTGIGKAKVWAHAVTSGSLSTVSPVSGTGFQVDTTTDRSLRVPVTYTPTALAAATCVVAISPDNTTYSTLETRTVPIGTALDSFVLTTSLGVPAGWYVKLTVTNGTLGTGTYY